MENSFIRFFVFNFAEVKTTKRKENEKKGKS